MRAVLEADLDAYLRPYYLVARESAAFVDRLYGGTVRFTTNTNGAVTDMVWLCARPTAGAGSIDTTVSQP